MGNALNRRAEPDCFSVVPDCFLSMPIADEPSVPIAGARFIGCNLRRENICECSRSDKSRGVKSLIPLVEVSDRRINTAIAQDRTGQALIRSLKELAALRVAVGAVANGGNALFVGDGAGHPQRIEDISL